MSEEPINPNIVPCKYCGQNIPETATFCWYCGRELIANPERPELVPTNKVNGRTLLVILLILAAATGLLVWSAYLK